MGTIGMIVPVRSRPVDHLKLGHDVRERRRALGLRQAELADLAAVSERFVRAVEQGKPSVRLDKFGLLLHALGLELRATARVVDPAATRDAR